MLTEEDCAGTAVSLITAGTEVLTKVVGMTVSLVLSDKFGCVAAFIVI